MAIKIIEMVCQVCGKKEQRKGDSARSDQIAYDLVWQHVMSSHRAESEAYRTLGIWERKQLLLSRHSF